MEGISDGFCVGSRVGVREGISLSTFEGEIVGIRL
jgi:hypothetical protein